MNEEIIREIEKADREQIQGILDAAMERYRQLYPQEEIVYFSLPKNDPETRKRLLQMMKTMLK